MPAALGFRHVALGADTSNLTGAPWLVQDFARLSVSVQTSAATASAVTLIGTNDDGLQSALGTPSHATQQNGWSIITALTGPGIWNFDPGALGFRWINAFRNTYDANTSKITVTIAGHW
jgi:hypothetical protein